MSDNVVFVRMTDAEKRKLETLAKAKGVSKAETIRSLVDHAPLPAEAK
jgi:hypothetical protein